MLNLIFWKKAQGGERLQNEKYLVGEMESTWKSVWRNVYQNIVIIGLKTKTHTNKENTSAITWYVFIAYLETWHN